MKTLLVVNPASANGRTGRQWPRIRDLARRTLGAFEPSFTEGRGHATTLAREAALDGIGRLVCVGGDGTLNEVINGVMNAHGPVRPDLLLGVVPMGTGCDLPRTLPIPRDPEAALRAIAACGTRVIDLGRMTFVGQDGAPAGRYFHNVVSFGLGGEVDARINRSSKALGGFLSFMQATLVSLLTYRKKSIALTVDGTVYPGVPSWNVAAANGQYHGGGMWVAPGASMDDGLLQITVVGDLSLAEVFWNLPRLYNGTIYGHRKIRRLAGRRIAAQSPETVLIDMDGEQPGSLPAALEVLPSALRILCP